MKVFINVWNSRARKVATQDHAADPEYATENVVGEVAEIRHLRRTGNGRTKCSNNWNEARKYDRPPAIFFVEIVGALQVTAAEEEGILPAVESGAGAAANPVAELISSNRAENSRYEKPAKRDDVLAGENPSGDQKGIAGEKEADE